MVDRGTGDQHVVDDGLWMGFSVTRHTVAPLLVSRIKRQARGDDDDGDGDTDDRPGHAARESWYSSSLIEKCKLRATSRKAYVMEMDGAI